MDMSDSNSPSPPAVAASSMDGPVAEQRVLSMESARVNLSALSSLSQTLAQQLAAQSSSIPRIFHDLATGGRYGTEALYLLALELRDIVHNIVVSTDEAEADERREASMSDASGSSSSSSSGASSSLSSRHKNRNFLTIDKHENAYKTRIKPIVESKVRINTHRQPAGRACTWFSFPSDSHLLFVAPLLFFASADSVRTRFSVGSARCDSPVSDRAVRSHLG